MPQSKKFNYRIFPAAPFLSIATRQLVSCYARAKAKAKGETSILSKKQRNQQRNTAAPADKMIKGTSRTNGQRDSIDDNPDPGSCHQPS